MPYIFRIENPVLPSWDNPPPPPPPPPNNGKLTFLKNYILIHILLYVLCSFSKN